VFRSKKSQPQYFFLGIIKLRAELCRDTKTSQYKTWAWKIGGLKNKPFLVAPHMLQIGLSCDQSHRLMKPKDRALKIWFWFCLKLIVRC